MTVVLSVGAFALGACLGTIGDGGTSGASGGGTMPSLDGGGAPSVWLTARVRRLSNRELDNSVKDLLGTSTLLSARLPPDTRQSGFTVNAAQRVDATYAGQLKDGVEALANEAVTQRMSTLVPCASSGDPRACATTFIDEFATRAFRRPLVDDQRAGLLAVYDTAAGGVIPDGGTIGTFADGIKAVIRAVLQSASFLYLTELGREQAGALLELDPYETASQLSYLVAAAPPDSALLALAKQDALRAPDRREAEARRLLASSPHAAQQLARFVKEWLRLDQLAQIERTSTVADTFATLSPLFDAETDAFIGEVVGHGDGTLRTMLTADFSMVNDKLAGFYGVPHDATTSWARASLASTQRRGLLSQSNFLSTYASNSPPGSSPVKRGKVVLNQLLCMNVQFPTDPNVAMRAMVPPPVDPTATTRERFERHASDPACRGCHDLLDGIGFAFENFDQIGKFRSTENGKPIDASGSLKGTGVDGTFANASELAGLLASSEQVRRCFAKNFFRFASGQTSDDTETRYLDVLGSMPAEARAQMTELVLAYIRSDLFMKRRAP
jgi:hypothetical protein